MTSISRPHRFVEVSMIFLYAYFVFSILIIKARMCYPCFFFFFPFHISPLSRLQGARQRRCRRQLLLLVLIGHRGRRRMLAALVRAFAPTGDRRTRRHCESVGRARGTARTVSEEHTAMNAHGPHIVSAHHFCFCYVVFLWITCPTVLAAFGAHYVTFPILYRLPVRWCCVAPAMPF
jgi:hypothetical protein